MTTREVHPKKIIETPQGKIVMEKPDMARKSALSNSIYTYLFTDEELLELKNMETDEERDRYIQIKSMKKGYTATQLSMLAYVTSAPFHINDYKKEPILDLGSFLEFLTPDLLKQMMDKAKEIGMIDPLSA